MDIKALREKLEEDRGRGGRTPRALQAVVVKFSEDRHKAGASIKAISNEIGISVHTLSYWRSVHRRLPGATLAKVKVVRATERPDRPEITVHGPRGLRIEGLSLPQLAELIARLQ
jgi:transposase